MKKTSFLALAVAALVTAASALTASAQKAAVRGVAFYNLENLFDTINQSGKYDLEFTPQSAKKWDTNKYQSKIHNMAYAISQLDTKTTPHGPAIIGISEVENRGVIEDLVADPALRDRNLQIVHHDSPDRRGVDVALLYDPKQFTFENATHHRLVVPDKPSLRTRDQTCVVGELFGQRVAVIVNHWPSRLGGQEQSSPLREAAAALSKSIADSLWAIDPDMGVIIMGDLNDDPQDKSTAEVLGARRDVKGIGPHDFYNPWWKTLDSGVGSLAYKGKWNLFDQIIVSGNLVRPTKPGRMSLWRNVVHNKEFLRDRQGDRQGSPLRTWTAGRWLNGYSDHFPTEVFFIKIIE